MMPEYDINWIQDEWKGNWLACAPTFAEFDRKHPGPKKCILTFGEHAGKDVSSVPEKYRREWLNGQKIEAKRFDQPERRERKKQYRRNGGRNGYMDQRRNHSGHNHYDPSRQNHHNPPKQNHSNPPAQGHHRRPVQNHPKPPVQSHYQIGFGKKHLGKNLEQVPKEYLQMMYLQRNQLGKWDRAAPEAFDNFLKDRPELEEEFKLATRKTQSEKDRERLRSQPWFIAKKEEEARARVTPQPICIEQRPAVQHSANQPQAETRPVLALQPTVTMKQESEDMRKGIEKQPGQPSNSHSQLKSIENAGLPISFSPEFLEQLRANNVTSLTVTVPSTLSRK